jgi:hypothetical protein
MIRTPFLPAALCALCLFAVSCKKHESGKNRSVQFRTVSVQKIHPIKDPDQNATLELNVTMDYPVAYANDSILKQLQFTFLHDLIPDLPDTATHPETAIAFSLQKKIRLYDASENPDETDLDDKGEASKTAAKWWDKSTLNVVYNKHGLLSYSVKSEQYTGGAHGGVNYRNALIDLSTGEKLQEEDLFTEESLPLINQILIKKLEAQNNVESPEELEQIGYFDVSQIGQYKNFYLTDNGLTYVFNAYEIGSYALGTIKLNLSFKDMEGFIAAGSPLEKALR